MSESVKPKKEFKRLKVVIKGKSPLLMNRLDPESLKSKAKMRTQEYSTKNDAEKSAYMAVIDGKRQLYIPMEALYSMIIGTAKGYKIKSRTSVSSLLAGTIRIEPLKVPLGTDQYEVDERAVVIQNNRVLKGRAMIKEWSAAFDIIYSTKWLPEGIETMLREILEDAGMRMGLLDYRPQHKGWFGTFEVESMKREDGTLVGAATTPLTTAAIGEEEPITEIPAVAAESAPEKTKKRGRKKAV